MQPDEYWKNFNLGTELDIAGRFLYNGLQIFHQMESFAKEEDAFEFLYMLSVGIERLLKIALILTEHDRCENQEKFEQELITHSHQELLRRLKVSHSLNLGPVHNEFIGIIARFYKSHRYGRYSLASAFAPFPARAELNLFLKKHLKIEINVDGMFGVTRNETRHKKFVGGVVSKIAVPIYEIIESEASRLKLFTYEIEYGSKASKIFQFRTFDFENEDILHAEVIIYLMSNKASGTNAKFLREQLSALSFDSALEADYLAALRSDLKKLMVMDELEALYADEVRDFAARRGILGVAFSDHLAYGSDEDECEGEE